jgi:hypothetical protein
VRRSTQQTSQLARQQTQQPPQQNSTPRNNNNNNYNNNNNRNPQTVYQSKQAHPLLPASSFKPAPKPATQRAEPTYPRPVEPTYHNYQNLVASDSQVQQHESRK